MEWKLFAHLRTAADGGTVRVDVAEGATVETALDALLAERPALAEDLLEDGELADHVRLLVDGEDPFADGDGLATTVDSESELALFPPVSGG
ncbi:MULTISPECIES: ubiquitin-like small modifier protein 1 [Haloarcula]|uniref:Molybdopterin synthase sulfur carrier subunit n=1 Tax=Haloarcula pellucida TaxID=1427151 RepID=A0A830GLG6_9EURY|nr:MULTISPECIES: ubiquitin-like small modifier protein 1 [Halomicroarcula]MBX0348467.1 MoaD/ThiS family protein [Halomicroarcula pellucida]MDS0278291.1 MoaD/ThiS family protein [Halomicroarcula sp. S1AR25-4]QIO23936.1 MoaD/ThiS family protein [Haloarcula sp. JP-L23]GGN93229.1 molybdopterin synthase sulfur carrier subunit [Halomicroarcula pellucida]